MKRKRILILLLLILFAIVLFDNFSQSQVYHYNTVSYQYGTNCDITDGALSKLNNKRYIFIFNNSDSVVLGNGTDNVILRQRGEIDYGISSFIPFYKSMEPELTFDCFIQNPKKYIGKVEINKKMTMSGFFNRSNMKAIIVSDYLNEARAILEYKSVAYNERMKTLPFNDSSHHSEYSTSNLQSKLMVCLSSPLKGFKRDLPIRQQDELYVDTIYFKNEEYALDYPLYETYKVDKLQKKLTYSSYNFKSAIIFSDTFTLEQVNEDATRFNSYTVQNLGIPKY